MTTAQPNSARLGRPKCGTSGMARENEPRPLQASRPVKISEPTPEASRPGSSTRPSACPPSPDASISRNAPVSGDPSSVLMAAKLPADATTVRTRSGASRRARRTVSAASPPPSAISGISGPSTAPKISVASDTRITPGSCSPPGEHPADGQHGQRPPGRLCMEAQAVRKAGEDLFLQVADQGQVSVRHRGDGRADGRGQRQQHQVAARTQQGPRIGRHRHQEIVTPGGPLPTHPPRRITRVRLGPLYPLMPEGRARRRGAPGGPAMLEAMAEDLRVTSRLVIPAGELHERFSRSSGPGGQSVNTTDSRVELSFDVRRSPSLPERDRERALRRLAGRLTDGVLTVASSAERSQLLNREAARARLAELLREALAPPPRPRVPTKPSRAARERRLRDKRRRAETKRSRRYQGGE